MLPGMDGTGEQFEDFLQFYKGESLVLQLPCQGDQSYASLAIQITNKLPDKDFILLAESFSGGLVEHLINVPHLRGVIFVASFISAPNRAMLTVAKLAPKKLLTYVPGNRAITRFLFLSSDYGKKGYLKFVKVVRSVPTKCLNNRITSMLELKRPEIENVDLPSAYIMPSHDRLIDKQKFDEISEVFANCKVYRLDGPHLILQTRAKQAAEVVTFAVHHITRPSTSSAS